MYNIKKVRSSATLFLSQSAKEKITSFPKQFTPKPFKCDWKDVNTIPAGFFKQNQPQNNKISLQSQKLEEIPREHDEIVNPGEINLLALSNFRFEYTCSSYFIVIKIVIVIF